jgi:uncharacterized protein (TIGR02246 family)
MAPALLLVAGSVVWTVHPVFNHKARAQAARESGKPAQPAAEDARPEDRSAIRTLLESLVKALSARNAKEVSALWTPEGEYQQLDGQTVRGPEAVEKSFAAFFAKTPEVKVEIRHGALRFLSKNSAIEEGEATLRRGPVEPASDFHFRALIVREDGRWRLAQLSESIDDQTSIAELGWLVGEWRSATGSGAEIQTAYSWAPNKKFLHVQFTIKEKQLDLSGTEVIGVDPATRALRSWIFESDGGVGEAQWTRDGDHWVLRTEGTFADGSSLMETNILRRVNENMFTLQSIERRHGDVSLADLPPVKVTRVKGAK